MSTAAAAPAGTSGAQPASPTGTQGATTTSSPAVDSQPALTGRAAIERDITALRSPEAVKAEGEDTPNPEAQEAGESAEAEGEKPDEGKAKKDSEKKLIPERVLHERLAREKKKLAGLQDQLSAATQRTSKLEAALQIALAENERLSKARAEGLAFDPKDEVIHAHELTTQAQKVLAEIDAKAKQAAEQAAEQAQVSFESEKLSNEIDDAIAAHNVLEPFGRSLLIEAMRKNAAAATEGREPLRSAREVAQALEEQFLERAKPRLVKERPQVAQSIGGHRSGGSNTAVQYSHDRKGILEHLEALRAAKG